MSLLRNALLLYTGGTLSNVSSSSRSLKSHRSQQHSASCSESLLLSTPCKLAGQPPLLNSSLHSVASDASLLSSLLDESSVQETTLVDTFWGKTPPPPLSVAALLSGGETVS